MTDRMVQIHHTQDGRERLFAVRSAKSLKDGLLGYYKESLEPFGYTNPLVKGNVMTVRDGEEDQTFIAKDVTS